MSDLVGNPNCWFSHAQAHLQVEENMRIVIEVLMVWYIVGEKKSEQKEKMSQSTR